MERICVYPGSFDPVTTGHMDVIERACRQWDRVIVAVLRNPAKPGCFSVPQRMELLKKACAHLPQVTVASFDGLTVDFVRSCGARTMVRGLRSAQDFDSERSLAHVNEAIAPEIETVFLMCRPEHSHVSSSAVREMASYGAPVTGFVPAALEKEICAGIALCRK